VGRRSCREAKNEPNECVLEDACNFKENDSVLLDKLKEQIGNFDGGVSSKNGNTVTVFNFLISLLGARF